MIELRVVRRMLRRGLVLGPVATVVVWILAGPAAAISTGVGVALALGNLYLAARLIGGVAENAPQLVMSAALGAFGIGMLALVGLSLILRNIDGARPAFAGVALIVTHLFLVIWEAAVAFLKMPEEKKSVTESASIGS